MSTGKAGDRLMIGKRLTVRLRKVEAEAPVSAPDRTGTAMFVLIEEDATPNGEPIPAPQSTRRVSAVLIAVNRTSVVPPLDHLTRAHPMRGHVS